MQHASSHRRSIPRGSGRLSLVMFVVSIALASGGPVAASPSADASPVWSIVSSPTPTGARYASLTWVSCPTTTSCFAVGYAGGTTSEGLFEHWNGRSWTLLPNPPSAYLRGLSCPNSTSCFAVGYTAVGSAVDHWNGSSWSIMHTPTPGGTGPVTLYGVSCHSTTFCFAVGTSGPNRSQRALVEHWNGRGWSITPSPNPPGAPSVDIKGVSCPSTTSCFLVGDDSSQGRSLVEHWNGTRWSITTSPNRAGEMGNDLNAVSCPSTTSCFAAGITASGGIANVYKSLVEHWDGRSWSIMTSPNPAKSFQTQLFGVSCHGTTSCFAVGGEGSNAGGEPGNTFVEHWNGSGWSIMASRNPSGTPGNVLNAVSCPGTTSCFAVGQANYAGSAPRGLIERYR